MTNYSLGDTVHNIVPLQHEDGTTVPTGTPLRIVAIVPKVVILKRDRYHDRCAYFFNAVPVSQDNDYSNRIRANFCTIKKG